MVTVSFAGESAEVVDHDELNLFSVRPAVRQHRLELGTIRRLGGFAPLREHAKYLHALTAAVGFACGSLCGQAEVLSLLLGRDPDVDHGTLSEPSSSRPQTISKARLSATSRG